MANINGTTGNDRLSGSVGAESDAFAGGTGNDSYLYTLGGGTDTITETAGTDTLVIDDANNLYRSFNAYRSGDNLVFDFAGAGSVTITNHYTDAAHAIEQLAFSDGWGPFTLSSSLTGTAGFDLLIGSSAGEQIAGNGGNDFIFANAGNDTVLGGGGDDEMRGGNGNDSIAGEAGDDDLFGGVGRDTLNGGSGWDVVSYFENNAGIVVNFSGDAKTLTIDSVSTTLANGAVHERTAATVDKLVAIEEVEGTRYADTFYGGRLDSNTNFQGNAGGDTFYTGGTGTWTHISYGDDISGVIVNMGGASITVNSTVVAAKTGVDSWGYIDKFKLGGGSIGLNGSDFADYLRGATDVTNWFSGGAGSDTLIGGSSRDYASYNSDDGSKGIIANLSAVSITSGSLTIASNRVRDEFGNTDRLTSIESIMGSYRADLIVGSAGSNELSGNGGNDTIDGGNGGDFLHGGDGNDRLIGGGSRDYLEGGAGTDTFVFTTLSDFGTTGDWDEIADFVSGTDKIDLSAINPGTPSGAFTFTNGSYDGDATGEVWYDSSSGTGIVMISTDADADAECKILITGTAPVAGDFIL